MAELVVQEKDAGAPIMDRSRLRVLLCDKDPIAAEEELRLLRRCSYQVTAVKTARQVVDLLNTCGSEVDLILTEVELPKEKGFRLLKHVVRQEQLKRIPIVMMSRRDEIAIVVKCLKLGAADYLVKPLRTNELLNLWTHMWRRRRMLGLAEKHVISGNSITPLYLLVSDNSESNHTNSTNLFSDDTDDMTRVTSNYVTNSLASCHLEPEMSALLELSLKPSLDWSAELAPQHCTTTTDLMPSPPRKTELKLGESSAFLTYTKAKNQSSERSGNGQSTGCKVTDAASKERASVSSSVPAQQHIVVGVPLAQSSHESATVNRGTGKDTSRSENGSEVDNRDSTNAGWNSSSLPGASEGKFPPQFPVMEGHKHAEAHVNGTAIHPLPPRFLSGIVSPNVRSSVLIPPSMHSYHGLSHDDAVNVNPRLPTMGAPQPGYGLPLASTFSCYPFGLHAATPPFTAFTAWPVMPTTSLIDHRMGQAERREAALNKFRRKRKDRCFEKKIRYVSHKKLAEG